MTTYKFDIFDVLNRINVRDCAFFNELTDEDIKAIHPLVLMRWMSGVDNRSQVFYINELLNPYIFTLQKHKRLLLRLLMVCGPNKPTRYKWIKQASQNTNKRPASIGVIQAFFGYSNSDACAAIANLTSVDILNMADFMGYQHDEMAKVCKEHGIPTKLARTPPNPLSTGFSF